MRSIEDIPFRGYPALNALVHVMLFFAIVMAFS